MNIKLKQLDDTAKMPEYAHPGDVGMDVFSKEHKILEPGEQYNFMVGFAMEFPVGYAAIVKDRSSMARKFSCHTLAGVYDAGYRGEYNVELINLGSAPVAIEPHQKIAQILLIPVLIPEVEYVDELTDSARGEGRFGSTGK